MLSARTALLTDLGDSPAVAGFDAPSSASPLVELVGVAGAGKTTLLKALTHRDPSLCTHPKVGPVRRLDLLARHTLRFVPRLLDRAHRGRWLSWHELRLMAYLEGWLPSAIHRTRPTLFDHGPIFILVQLSEFGPPLVASPDFQAWWRAARSAWARALGIVVWLDAPTQSWARASTGATSVTPSSTSLRKRPASSSRDIEWATNGTSRR